MDVMFRWNLRLSLSKSIEGNGTISLFNWLLIDDIPIIGLSFLLPNGKG
jgi:hypothetical protein